MTAFVPPAALPSPGSRSAPRASRRRCSHRRTSTLRAVIDLGGDQSQTPTPPSVPSTATPQDVLLGELMFTPPEELPKMVETRLDELDDDFYSYVEEKIEASMDLEERDTLRTFLDAVRDLAGQIEKAVAGAAEGVVVDPAQAAQATYDSLLDDLTGDPQGVRTAVANNYDRVDNRFLETLAAARAAKNDPKLDEIHDAIAEEMQTRIKRATDRLVSVLQAGPPEEMEKQLVTVASRGWVDEAFMLLLAGNIDQAEKAQPGSPVVAILKDLQRKAIELRDDNVEPEVALIRRLLRTEDKDARKAILVDALTPASRVALSDGKTSSGVKVEGKKLVEALRKSISEFGNLDGGKFAEKLGMLGAESEDVALEIFGLEQKDMKELQDDAFHKRSVSVWELEKVEMEHEVQGTKAPWEDRPPGFNEEGKMQL